eukprot:TRINITY_DN18936_c0_g2_i1.p1 TRINITY_DN18936_c0_g2~~TRINITY_DN18936_c0_g2_i1.p1  ORF type:complete len:290 (-),score=52.69 TRINITY_DN18936_c0_g2_i1:129-896(-)
MNAARKLQGRLRQRVICFDLDDTLWSMSDTIRAAHNAMVDHMRGLSAALGDKYSSPLEFKRLADRVHEAHPSRASDFTFTRKEAIRMAFQEFGVEEGSVDACFDAFWVQRNRPHFFPGAVDTLHELRRRGFRLGAITDGNANVMTMPCLEGLFEFAVRAEEVGAGKPDPRIFRRALELAGCEASDMLYVGDNFAKDVRGPAALSIDSIWVYEPSRQPDPDFHWGSPVEVPEDVSLARAVVADVRGLLELIADAPA